MFTAISQFMAEKTLGALASMHILHLEHVHMKTGYLPEY